MFSSYPVENPTASDKIWYILVFFLLRLYFNLCFGYAVNTQMYAADPIPDY